jgi:hypothetical protein
MDSAKLGGDGKGDGDGIGNGNVHDHELRSWLKQFSRDGRLDVHEGSLLHRLSEDIEATKVLDGLLLPCGLPRFIKIAFSPVESLRRVVPSEGKEQQEKPLPSAAASRRAALALESLARLWPDRRLECLHLSYDSRARRATGRSPRGAAQSEEEEGRRLRDAVDAFLEGMASSVSPIPFDSLTLDDCFGEGGDAGPWSRFVERCCRGAQGGSSSILRTLSISTFSLPFSRLATRGALEVPMLPETQCLKVLYLDHNLDSQRSRDETRWLSEAVARSPRLTKLDVYLYKGDGSTLLNGALGSLSLREISLQQMRLLAGKEPKEGCAGHCVSANSAVKRIKLEKCKLGDEGVSLLSWFRGLETIELDHVKIEMVPTDATGPVEASEAYQLVFAQFSALQTLKLASDCPATHRALLLAVPSLPLIKTLDLTLLYHNGTDSEKQSAKDDVRFISETVARSRSLKKLRAVVGNRLCNVRDVCILLEGAMKSVSLECIAISRIQLLKENSSPEPRQCRARVSNNTLKAVSLPACSLGLEGWSLLSCFKGLETITFEDVTVEPDASEQSARTLAGFNKLQSVNIRGSLLPAVTDVLVGASAPLSIELRPPHHDGFVRYSYSDIHDNIPFLCAGIEAASSLADLTVVLVHPWVYSIAPLLGSLQRSSTLVRFAGRFYFNRHTHASLAYGADTREAAAVGPHLETLLAGNATLECLDIVWDPCMADTGHLDRVAAILLPYVVRGVRRNRTLKALSLRPDRVPHFRADSQVSESIAEMLQNGNTVLQRLEGIAYDSEDRQARIDHLLKLNRYSQDFVAEAGRGVPLESWGDVLTRIDNADCNGFVAELARQALEGSAGVQDGLRSEKKQPRK